MHQRRPLPAGPGKAANRPGLAEEPRTFRLPELGGENDSCARGALTPSCHPGRGKQVRALAWRWGREAQTRGSRQPASALGAQGGTRRCGAGGAGAARPRRRVSGALGATRQDAALRAAGESESPMLPDSDLKTTVAASVYRGKGLRFRR